MTPENSNPSKLPAVFGSWEWYLECEERSLDRLIEMTRRSAAAARAILNLKFRLIAANLPITLTAPEHAMMAADFERWAGDERDPKKAAELASLGRLARALCKAAVEREEAAKKAKRPRKRCRGPKRSSL
jgi:hypothetical protein